MRSVMHTLRATGQGFTLSQLLVTLAGLLALALVLPPVVAMSVNAARVSRAARDAARIAAAVERSARDLGEYPRWVSQADRAAGLSARRLRMLAGPGDLPKVTGDASWLASSADSLTRQLVQNGPGYPTEGGNRGWRGPYLLPDAGPDPWGNQFLVWFADDGATTGAFVVSAGPDGSVGTDVPALRSTAGVVGDDVVVGVPPH